jgi:hypothetical protein
MPALVFDDVLDERLGSAPATAQPTASSGRYPGPAGVGAAYGFFFASSPNRTGLRTMAGSDALLMSRDERAGVAAYVEAVFVAGEALTPRVGADARPAGSSSFERPVRMLSQKEREAVAAMEALGATLVAGFSLEELRRAFRTLALAYHPDRHAERGEHDTAHLAQLFTQARDAYEVLTGIFQRVH